MSYYPKIIHYLLSTFAIFHVYIASYAQSFSTSNLQGTSLSKPTSLQFGPDGRLYVSQQSGAIKAYTVVRNDANNYSIIATETINLIANIQNHNDDGTLDNTNKRQVTGVLVTGTAQTPVLYVSSSDSRIGAGTSNGDVNLDTNSGTISRLTWNGSSWVKVDIVRGLPRSEENHASNGMQLDKANNVLYLASGGNTNAGAPSANFAFISEYALAACILAIDLDAIEAMPVYTDPRDGSKFIYDIPTLNDPTRPDIGNTDPNFPYPSGHPMYNSLIDIGDPFGGNDGLNQGKIVPGGPVQVFAPGFRNIYDLLLTDDGRMYTWSNGANGGWGGHPHQEGGGNATNNWLSGSSTSGAMPSGWTGQDGIVDGNVNNKDGLHFVGHVSDYNPFDPNANPTNAYYGGHPTPIRANPAGAGLYTHDYTDGGNNGTAGGVWRTQVTNDPTTTLPVDWPPVPVLKANPIEGDFQNPGVHDPSFWAFEGTSSYSTNGLALYTASNFNNAKKGHLLAASMSGHIYEVSLNASGTIDHPRVTIAQNPDVNSFGSNFGDEPLDVIAQGDNDPFAGTVWVANYSSNTITIFEPQDFFECFAPGDPNYDPDADYDSDGYSNDHEIQSNSDPCNGASMPSDADQDFIADRLDPDDDNDNINDVDDVFPLDPDNGLSTSLPINYPLLNGDPGTGIKGLGFTGLMANGDDYLDLIKDKDNSNVIILYGGAPGQLGIGGPPGDGITPGDANGSLNNQENAFQFGVKVNSSTAPFTVESEIVGPLFDTTPEDFQSAGIFIGNGDQDNYVKIVGNANGGQGGILVVAEFNGTPTSYQYDVPGIVNADYFKLMLSVNPQNGTVQPKYSLEGGNNISVGDPIQLTGEVLNVVQGAPAMAVGAIATSRGSSSPFEVSWDNININFDAASSTGEWKIVQQNNTPTARYECAYVQVGNKFYLLGGRGSQNKKVDIFNYQTHTWSSSAGNHPIQLHHFQSVAYKGLIYVMGAFTGGYPDETPVDKIYIYNPATDTWHVGANIPRPRGSAGVVVYNDKIYMVGGLKDGHNGDYVLWFDEYDPKTGIWKVMPDMPRFRDHFQAAVVGNKLVAAAGRVSDADDNIESFNYSSNLIPPITSSTNHNHITVSKVDIFDFNTGSWVNDPTIPNIPTPRAGTAVGTIGNEVIVIGGESKVSDNAHNETEAFNVNQHQWRTLASLLPEQNGIVQGRHATQAITNNGGIYVAAGNNSKGGGIELNSQQAFYMFGETAPTGTPLSASTLAASTSSLNFGTVNQGQIVTKKVTLTNQNGNQGILLKNISLSGSNDYQITNGSLPALLLPGGSVDISIAVQPTSSQTTQATLTIAHSAGSNINVSLTTNGSGGTTPGVLYRVNAAGPLVNGTPNWTADNSGSPSSYVTGGNYSFTTDAVTLGSSVPAGTPASLFQTERYSKSPLMTWAFPVQSGQAVEVRIYLAEIYYTAPNKRVFDVLIDGNVVDANVDAFALAGGHDIGIMRSYNITSDGTVNISFVNKTNYASIKAIEIIGGGSGGTQNTPPVVANPINDVSVQAGASPMAISLSNVFSDAQDAFAALSLTSSSSKTSVVTSSISGSQLTLTFTGSGTANVTVRATDTNGAFVEDVFAVTVSGGGGTTPGVLYRVNAAGGQLSGDPVWTADFRSNSSPYSSGGNYSSTTDVVSLEASVPAGTPAAMFQTEHYSKDPLLTWAFPVQAGTAVEVRLYLAEIYYTAAGKRVFDILIDGNVVDADVDVFALAGHDKGIMRSYNITSDGSIDISFNNKANYATIKGVEIVGAGETARMLSMPEKGNTQASADEDVKKTSLFETNEIANIYPNPFESRLDIYFKNPVNIDDLSFSVINNLGVKIPLTKSSVSLTDNTVSLDFTYINLSSGIFMLEVEDKRFDTIILHKIVKLE